MFLHAVRSLAIRVRNWKFFLSGICERQTLLSHSSVDELFVYFLPQPRFNSHLQLYLPA